MYHTDIEGSFEEMEEKITWKDKKLRVATHYAMSACAGFMGAYTLVTGIALFGNSQTANMIGIAIDIVGKDPVHLLLRVVGLLIYAAGIVGAVLLSKKSGETAMILSPIVDAAAFFTIAFLPEDVHALVRLYPAFFAMAFQWTSFPKINGYTSATVFSTNNFRQMVSGYTEFICTHKREELNRALFYTGTLASFNLFAGVSYFLFTRFSDQSALFGIPVTMAALGVVIAYVVHERRMAKTMA